LRPLTRSGQVRADRLHTDSIGRIVQRVMLAHFTNEGFAPDQAQARARRYTSHSARVGFCVTATEAGVPPQHIAAVVRHRGLAMTRRYSKQADMLACAPHARKGVGV
jgi:hypothetical protein